MSKREKNDLQKTLPFVAFLFVMTLLNVVVFYSTSRSVHVFCSADSVLEALAVYIAHNGQYQVERFLARDCPKVSDKVKRELRDIITGLTTDCSKMKSREQLDSPLITLFTTHAAHSHTDEEKYSVHNNTLINWASFKPKVNLVLYTNDSSWISIAQERGWEVIPIAEKTTPPLLKDMFEFSKTRYDTPWYGYVNADILFTKTFIQTLEGVTHRYNAKSDRVLLTGRRLNVANLSVIDAASDASLSNTVKMYGQLFREDAEDFFIATKVFPWENVLPVVVGIPGYDNWLIAEARCHLNATVIDVTETLEAVHQTTKTGGNREGHSHSRATFNYRVFKKANITPNFIAGLTDCTEYRTYRTFCDTVDVVRRTNLGSNCICKR